MRKRLDLTGDRYGQLTVLYETDQVKTIRYWMCRCDCGNEIIAAQQNLRSGHTKSCGCIKVPNISSANSKDLTGKRFGSLYVNKKVGIHPTTKSSLWECHCDCGETTTVTSTNLVSGNTRSCGCGRGRPRMRIRRKRRTDLTGERYGRLKVVEQSGIVDGRTTWICDCDCGNRIVVKGVYLTTGETKSCGCLKDDQEQVNLRLKYDSKRVDGVVKPLFKGQEPRKDSSTGFRGVNKYYTRKSQEVRYRAWITVKGKKFYKGGFKTAEDAYYNGRLVLENKHLPKDKDK